MASSTSNHCQPDGFGSETKKETGSQPSDGKDHGMEYATIREEAESDRLRLASESERQRDGGREWEEFRHGRLKQVGAFTSNNRFDSLAEKTKSALSYSRHFGHVVWVVEEGCASFVFETSRFLDIRLLSVILPLSPLLSFHPFRTLSRLPKRWCVVPLRGQLGRQRK